MLQRWGGVSGCGTSVCTFFDGELPACGACGDATGSMRSTLTNDESLRLAVLLERDGITAVARRANCTPNTLRAARGGRLLSGPTVTVLRHLLAPPSPARAA